jgi:hypothetical protein
MKILCIQPPFVQLNTPYPSTLYLSAFLKSQGYDTVVLDLSNKLFRKIFSKKGLEIIFSAALKNLEEKDYDFDDSAWDNIFRYLSNSGWYCSVIESLVNFLSGHDQESGHWLSSVLDVPFGSRAEAWIESLEGVLTADDSLTLASLILDDLADFIKVVLDPDFSLIKYGETKSLSQPWFAEIQKALESSWLLSALFDSVLEEELSDSLLSETLAACISIPFPGTLKKRPEAG